MELKPFENKVWLSSPTMHGEELKYMTEAYETNWMSTVGKNIDEVERLTCEKIGCKYSVALSAGTAALHMAMKLAGIKPGDRVFCSDVTFDATVNPVVHAGCPGRKRTSLQLSGIGFRGGCRRKILLCSDYPQSNIGRNRRFTGRI